MEFCPECESMMRLHKEKGKSVFKCKCGYIKEADEGAESVNDKKYTSNSKESELRGIEIIDDDIETLPTKVEECPKCGNKKASYWQVQTRSGDEAMTTFFRCTKCRFTWREY
ncbi:MAG: transcription factor S [Candidatus Helarchaeota archaeon]